MEILCDPWGPVESIPTCSPMSLETVRVICSHVSPSLMVSRPLLVLPVGDASGYARVGKPGPWSVGVEERKPPCGLFGGPSFSCSCSLDRIIGNWPHETSRGHQGSARGLGVSVGDSNSLQGCPRACRNAFHGSPRVTRDLHG